MSSKVKKQYRQNLIELVGGVVILCGLSVLGL
jgi:hypothetical protein